MDVFLELFLKILPLYTIIFFGFIAGRYLKVERSSIAPLLLYLVSPVVTFKGIFQSQLSWTSLIYVGFYFIVCVSTCLLFYYIGKLVYKNDQMAGLLAISSSLANVAYFGLPFVFMMLGEQYLGPAVLCILGLVIHENSIAFFIAARGNLSSKQALIKTLKIPTIYAAILAVLCHFLYQAYQANTNIILHKLGDPLIESFLMTMDKFVGALTLLGMLIIGLGLARLKNLEFDWSFISISFVAKFLFVPALVLLLILFDTHFVQLLEPDMAHLIFYLSLVPIGANTITLAANLDLDTDKVSVTVMASTIFALIYIPLVSSLNIFEKLLY